MKKLVFLPVLVFFVSCAEKEQDLYLFSTFHGNGDDGLHFLYSEDGYKWTTINNDESVLKPEVGRDKLMRDPCIIKGGDGLFHMVWTVSWQERGIGYANSKDLIYWSEQKYLPVMHHEPDARNSWAPELFYDETNDIYAIYWASTIPGRFPETDTLGDDGFNHRMYYTTTKDFVDFSDTKVLLDPGFNVIDAHIMKENDEYIMFVKDETLLPAHQKNIKVTRSKNLLDGYGEVSESLTTDWVEGPTVMKINGEWIMYYDEYYRNKIGAIASPDLKNWTVVSEKLNFPEKTGHGTILKVKKSIVDKIVAEYSN